MLSFQANSEYIKMHTLHDAFFVLQVGWLIMARKVLSHCNRINYDGGNFIDATKCFCNVTCSGHLDWSPIPTLMLAIVATTLGIGSLYYH